MGRGSRAHPLPFQVPQRRPHDRRTAYRASGTAQARLSGAGAQQSDLTSATPVSGVLTGGQHPRRPRTSEVGDRTGDGLTNEYPADLLIFPSFALG